MGDDLKTAYLGLPTVHLPVQSEISLEGWSHQKLERGECAQMVRIGTRPREVAYFDVGDLLRVAEPAK